MLSVAMYSGGFFIISNDCRVCDIKAKIPKMQIVFYTDGEPAGINM